jgi:hypothetical protein
MISMKLARTALAATLIPVLHAPPATAADLFVSQNGNDANSCILTSPCLTLTRAISRNEALGGGLEIGCLDGGDYGSNSPITKSVIIDCSGTDASIFSLTINGSGAQVTLRNFTILNLLVSGIVLVNGSLTVDNVHIFKVINAISAVPTGPSKLVVKNSIFDYNNAGVVIKPASGGSLTATFDHVTISGNAGGGLKTDTTTSGPVVVEIVDSNISYNGGNGVNVVSGASGSNLINLSRDVVALNGVAGIQANGLNSAAIVDTTLLDSNASGATSVVSGGRLVTYGNNRIIGSPGSGFTSTAVMQ